MAQESPALAPLGMVERPAAPPVETTIVNGEFMMSLDRLRELRNFLQKEAISVEDGEGRPLTFGGLNQLQRDYKGREPTLGEWTQLESLTQRLFGLLTPPLRRKFVSGEIPRWVSLLPIALAGIALGALILAVASLKLSSLVTLPCYLVWLMSLGAIGSVAFIGMNALSVQQDITFDLSNRTLMILRITLGALFGLVLTLPFGFDGFRTFVFEIAYGKVSPNLASPQQVTTQALLLLLPFILGFSTSVVIVILNRLVDSVQAFFGRGGAPANESQGASTPKRAM